jgi:hypothetical protein
MKIKLNFIFYITNESGNDFHEQINMIIDLKTNV